MILKERIRKIKKTVTPSASLDIAGMMFSDAIDCSTLGVPYSVARHEEMEDR